MSANRSEMNVLPGLGDDDASVVSVVEEFAHNDDVPPLLGATDEFGRSRHRPAKDHPYETERLELTNEIMLRFLSSSWQNDALTSIANSLKKVCRVQYGVISVQLGTMQWFKAISEDHDLPPTTDRDSSFCRHAILQHGQTFTVSDTTQSDVFAENPLVLNHPNIRYYSGASFQVHGLPIGAVCIIDTKPHDRIRHSSSLLESYATLVGTIVEAQLDRQRLMEWKQQLDDFGRGLLGKELYRGNRLDMNALFRDGNLFVNSQEWHTLLKSMIIRAKMRRKVNITPNMLQNYVNTICKTHITQSASESLGQPDVSKSIILLDMMQEKLENMAAWRNEKAEKCMSILNPTRDPNYWSNYSFDKKSVETLMACFDDTLAHGHREIPLDFVLLKCSDGRSYKLNDVTFIGDTRVDNEGISSSPVVCLISWGKVYQVSYTGHEVGVIVNNAISQLEKQGCRLATRQELVAFSDSVKPNDGSMVGDVNELKYITYDLMQTVRNPADPTSKEKRSSDLSPQTNLPYDIHSNSFLDILLGDDLSAAFKAAYSPDEELYRQWASSVSKVIVRVSGNKMDKDGELEMVRVAMKVSFVSRTVGMKCRLLLFALKME